MIGSDFETRKYTAMDDIQEMINANPGSNINIVLQTGGGMKNETSSSIDFTKVQRHQITDGALRTLIDLGSINMAEPNTLSDFISWGISEYPAERYAIILWDHGSGIHGFGKDINFHNDALSPFELYESFYYGLEDSEIVFDLVGFDACLMSSLEVASKLNYFANYMAASEEIVPEWGWNYTDIIKNLNVNPKQTGELLGKNLINSYFNSSKKLSDSQNYGTYQEITLSLINMSNVPQLIADVNNFSKSISSNLVNLDSSISLSRSIDQTERYGQSALGRSTGLIDLYDFTVNLEGKYPESISSIKAVQKSINSTIEESRKGDARPNAKGISIYMPLFKSEFNNNAELQTIDVDWLTLLYTQRLMIENDILSPVIKSEKRNGGIEGNVYGSDIANIFAEIVLNSSNTTKLQYVQELDNTFVDNNGHFNYNDHRILTLCNETECIPTSINIESNRDKKFVFIPMRLETSDGGVNHNASLVYEFKNDSNFTFLGVTPETNPSETIPKGKSGLESGDKIFLESTLAEPLYTERDDLNSSKFRDIVENMNGGPLLVNNSEKIVPKFLNITSPFHVRLTFCDYSDNCDRSRWHLITPNANPSSSLPYTNQSEYVIVPKLNSTTSNSSTYSNPFFGFQIDFPRDWVIKTQNVTDFSDFDLSADPFVVEFIPSEFAKVFGTDFYPSVHIRGTEWPFEESAKTLFDQINKTGLSNSTILLAEDRIISDNPGFTFILEYFSEPEQFLGIAEEKRIEMITSILMDGKLYDIVFGAYKSQFDDYLPVVEDIANSFRKFSQNNNTFNNNNVSIVKITSPLTIIEPSNNNKDIEYERPVDLREEIDDLGFEWSRHVDPKYNYEIDYPSNLGIGKPVDLENFNSNLTGNLFLLENSSVELSDSTMISIDTFHIEDKKKLNKIFNYDPKIKNLTNYDADFIMSMSDKELYVYSVLPEFELFNNQTLKINNNTVYLIEYKYYNPIVRSMSYATQAYIINNPYLAIFQMDTNPQDYEIFYPVIQRMINSFEFQKG
jgi:hypothetical protein